MSQVEVNTNFNSVNVENTINTIDVNQDFGNILIVPQQTTNIVEIVTPGPQGPQGPPGDPTPLTGSFVTTSSFNAFTSSYNTGSFTGSFAGDGSKLTNISASNVVGLNLSQIASGSVTASISPNNGFVVNTNTTITGSLFVTNGITGSLFGTSSFALTASYASNVPLTASFAVSASQAISASYAVSASYEIVYEESSSYADYAVSASQAVTASFALTASYASNVPETASFAISASQAISASYASNLADQGYNFTQTIAAATWSINHNLNTLTPLVDVYNLIYSQLIPAQIISINANNLEVRFSSPNSGYAILSKGSGVSSTYAVTASYAITASYSNYTGYNFIQTASSDTWVINHNLNNQYPLVQVYTSNNLAILPASISGSDFNTTIITFSSARTGYVRIV